MKRITLLLLTAFSVLFAYADDDLTGKASILDGAATELATGQWYALYNGSTFLFDNGDGSLGTSSTPARNLASNYEGVFVQLESAGNDTYYLKTHLGNYIGALSSDATTSTSASATAAYTIELSGSAWTLKNGNLYLGSNLKGSSSATTWTFYSVSFKEESDLTVAERYSFHTNMLKDGSTLFRLNCRRSTTTYLTSTASGSASGASLKNNGTDLSQIWVVTQSGDGYTFMNASTGEYLTSSYASTGSATTLYLQQSPNVSTDLYYNISSASDFSGNSCLNLNGTTLYQWSYSDDAGSDWAMTHVYEVSIDDVREALMSSNEYAWSLTDGSYYRIISYAYGSCMTESDSKVVCTTINDVNYRQYWKLSQSGQGWSIQNVMTDNYIGLQSKTYAAYPTQTEAQTLYPRLTGDEWNPTWFIANQNNGTNPILHCQSDATVVPWDTSADASMWYFEEVELTSDEITAAREQYNDYLSLAAQVDDMQTALDNLFSDKACTTLKDDIASLTDDELANNSDYASLPTEVQEMVLKVKNDTWDYATSTSTVTQSYEKFFRIADYRVYSNYSSMASAQGQSNSFGKLSGPTGIYLKTGDVLFVYVDEDASSDCTLQAELVSTDGVPGNHTTGATTNLSAGLNLIYGSEDDVVYIFYQVNETSKYIADYPDIKIHIEGGTVNGYFDATRDMTNQDWANMKTAGLLNICPVINLKTEHLVFAMDAELVMNAITAGHKSAGDSQEDVEKLLRIWDMIPANEESYQGLEAFDGRFRNVWNCFSIDYQYMFATTYGTYYENSTLASVMNYYSMTHQGEGNEGGSLWGPSHEMGHNHQNLINLVGTTESSNNLFSNINMFEQGVSTSRGPSPQANFDNFLAEGDSWLDRDIWTTTRMFMQLYLYFHVMKNDTTFVPSLFKTLRNDPMSKKSSMSGSTDYLKFAQTVCQVANADLSEFFEAYGMFVPVDNYMVDDYSTYYVTTTQSEINSALKAMQKYEKKLGNIMFIDDHIAKKLADPDNKFEAVPASDGYKVNCGTEKYYAVGSAGDCGDYEDYDGHTEYDVTNDYYTLNSSTSPSIITFHGSGYVGHKVYDLSGNLIWACNMETSETENIPTAIRSLFPDNVVVVAAEENMSDVPCPFYKRGSSEYAVYGLDVTFQDGVSNKWYANDGIDDYLPANALAIITNSGAPESLTSSVNVVNTDSTAQSIVIDGDLECHIPKILNAASLSFTKSGSGFQALVLPFDVDSVNSIVDYEYVYNTTAPAGSPAIYKDNVAINLENVSLTAGDFTAAESGNVLDPGGKYVVAATDVSPFTYLFKYAFEIGNFDSIETVAETPEAASNGAIYDLSGRRISKVTKPGIYIVNGKKMLLK
ncbi:MAG: M60 family metallopeptidase [Prevotellaceae bacterium]|nr:M60 family metallopeptidase [Prevotellaceae bacterium]